MTIALTVWTVLIIFLVGLVTFTAKGEDVMGLPLVYSHGAIAVAGPWIVFGIFKLVERLL